MGCGQSNQYRHIYSTCNKRYYPCTSENYKYYNLQSNESYKWKTDRSVNIASVEYRDIKPLKIFSIQVLNHIITSYALPSPLILKYQHNGTLIDYELTCEKTPIDCIFLVTLEIF